MPAGSQAAAGPLLARTAGRRARRRVTIAGLVLAGVAAVAGTVAAVLALAPGPALRLPRDTVFGLRAGQCVDAAPDGVSGARAVSCSQPHQAEIYATYRLAGALWPGAAAAGQRARRGCLDRLGGYLDQNLVGSSLTASYAYPDLSAWTAGERTVVCEIRSASGPLTGPVRGLGLSTS